MTIETGYIPGCHQWCLQYDLDDQNLLTSRMAAHSSNLWNLQGWIYLHVRWLVTSALFDFTSWSWHHGSCGTLHYTDENASTLSGHSIFIDTGLHYTFTYTYTYTTVVLANHKENNDKKTISSEELTHNFQIVLPRTLHVCMRSRKEWRRWPPRRSTPSLPLRVVVPRIRRIRHIPQAQIQQEGRRTDTLDYSTTNLCTCSRTVFWCRCAIFRFHIIAIRFQ